MQPDQAREPALERALPTDAVPDSTISEGSEAEVLLGDGSWVWCQVIGQPPRPARPVVGRDPLVRQPVDRRLRRLVPV